MKDDGTIAAYNEYADVYDQEVIDFWEQFPKEFIKRFADGLPGKRVLNVGSGSGRDALLLRESGLEVVCIDASKSMIAITTKLGFESHLVKFSDISFPPASYDGIWAYTSLIHVPKQAACKAIQDLRSLLRPGGTFAIGVIIGDKAGMVDRGTMPDASRYFKYYQKQELVDLIEPLGYKLSYECEYQPHRSVYLNQLYKLA